jgi:hypothetical protein
MQPNTVNVANESLRMAEKTGDKKFNIIAIGLMAITGVATMLHALHSIVRDLRDDRRRDLPTPNGFGKAGRIPPHPSRLPDEDDEPVRTRPAHDRQGDADLTWGQRAERSGREPNASHADAVHRNPHAARHR